MMKGFLKNMISVVVSLSLVAFMPVYSSVYAEEGGIIFKVSSVEETVGNDVRIDITSSGDVGFSSGKFSLHYNNEILAYKGFDLPTASDINQDDISVSNDNQGITYIVFTVEDIANAAVSFDFSTISPGNCELTLDVNELFNKNDEAVNFTVENGMVTVKSETTTTATTTTTSTTTTTTTTSTSTTESTTTDATSTSEQTTTSVESTSTSHSGLTETSTTSATSLSETTTTVTETSTNNDGATTNATSDGATETSTTVTTANTNKNTTVSTKNTSSSTSKATTATVKLNNSSEKKEESAQTGDSFPFLPLVVAIGGSATLAFVTRKKKA